MWLANLVDAFVVYQTTLKLFSTSHFYFIVALNVGVVFLADSFYVFIKKEYFTETVDFLKAMINRGQEDNEGKLGKLEQLIEDTKARAGNVTPLPAYLTNSAS